MYFLPALFLRALGWRVLRLTNAHRIGHLAAEPDCLIKEERLGLFPKRRALLLAPRGAVANERMVDYWSSQLRAVRSPVLCRLLAPLNRFAFARMRDDLSRYVAAINETAAAMRIFAQWGERPPLLALAQDDLERGERRLRELGLPPGARFVCLHSRDGGYSPADEHLHDFRNTSVENYLGAATTLVARGFHCIRMGDPSTARLPPMQGVVDYAHSPLRADWMDIFLCARCEFFIGNSSGLSFVAGVFGRPSCLANLVPFSGAFPYWPRDLGLPKLLRQEGRLLGFAEILASDAGQMRFSDLYAEHCIEPIENSAEDIRDLALEMVERMAGRPRVGAEDEARQARFRALLRPGHFSHGSAGRVGRDFLRKYEHLIGDQS